jgi:Mannose-6-phosphate isomerase
MKHTRRESERVELFDGDLNVEKLFDREAFSFDVAVGTLDGYHPPVVNNESDRAYYVLSGEGSIRVNDSWFDVSKSDLVEVPAGKAHALKGEMRYLIITSPPFDPANEEMLDEG